MSVQGNDKGIDEPSVTGLEKLGSSVNGRHSVNFDYLPIKKRRPPLRSPSPPLQTPLDGICAPHDSVFEPAQLTLNSFVGEKTSRGIESALVNTNLPRTQGSSSFPLLSAAFCKGTNVDNAKIGVTEDKSSTPHAIDTSMDSYSLEKAAACSEGETLILEDNICEAHIDYLGQIDSTTVSSNFLDQTEIDVEKCYGLVKDVKASASVEGETLILDDPIRGAHNDSLVQSDYTTVSPYFLYKTENDAEKCSSLLKDVKFQWDLNAAMDEWDSPTNDCIIGSHRNSIENISSGGLQSGESDNLHTFVELKDSENALELLKCNSRTEGHGLLINELKFPNRSSYPEQPLEGKMNPSTKFTILARENIFTSNTQPSQILPMKNVKFEEHDDVLANPAVSGKSRFEMVCIKSQEEYTKLYDVTSNRSTVSQFTIAPDVNISSSKPREAVFPYSLSDKKITSRPETALNECAAVLDYVNKENDISARPNVAPLGYSLADLETKELMPKSNEHFGDVAVEDPLGDGDVSDISLGGHDNLVRLKNVIKYPTDYESPFEDGELRETVALSWEENECETECLDHDIDDRYAYEFGTGSLCMSEAGSKSMQNNDNAKLPEKDTCGSVNSLKESSNSASVENISEDDQIAETIEANNCKTDVVSDSKRSFSEEIRSREVREKLSSRVGESPVSGSFDEKDNLYMRQGRSGSHFQAGQNLRSEKYAGRDRHVPQMQAERHKNNWIGALSSYMGSRNNFQNNYRGGGSFSRLRSTIPEFEINDKGLGYHDNSAKGMHRALVRRRPLDNNGNTCSTLRENIESRYDKNGMIRGRTEIYHPGGFRVPRGENHGHLHNRNPGFLRPGRRYGSRSRTRSPIPWHAQEERNKGPRVERTRIHYEDSKFEVNDEGLLSPPRKRYFNDRNGGPSRFRGPNSPGRFIGHRRGYDSPEYVERMRSDDGSGPRVHPQRFFKPSREACRGHDYDNNNNERTKYRDRNDMIPQNRHGDNDGASRRFRTEGEDCFDMRSSRSNNDWEGRGSFKYDRERRWTIFEARESLFYIKTPISGTAEPGVEQPNSTRNVLYFWTC